MPRQAPPGASRPESIMTLRRQRCYRSLAARREDPLSHKSGGSSAIKKVRKPKFSVPVVAIGEVSAGSWTSTSKARAGKEASSPWNARRAELAALRGGGK